MPALDREAIREPGAEVHSTTFAAEADSEDAPAVLPAGSSPTRLGDFELVQRLGEETARRLRAFA